MTKQLREKIVRHLIYAGVAMMLATPVLAFANLVVFVWVRPIMQATN